MKNGNNEFSIPLNSTINKNSDNSNKAKRKLVIICLTCLIFMCIELIGGIWANSLAIMTDAAHLLSDLAGFIISIISLQYAKQAANNIYTFGYYRAEIVGAFLSVIIIWILTIILLCESIERFFDSHHEIDGEIMLITASIGLVFNLIMVYILHSDVDGHSHCGHNYSHNHEHNNHANNHEHNNHAHNHEHNNHSHNHSHDNYFEKIENKGLDMINYNEKIHNHNYLNDDNNYKQKNSKNDKNKTLIHESTINKECIPNYNKNNNSIECKDHKISNKFEDHYKFLANLNREEVPKEINDNNHIEISKQVNVKRSSKNGFDTSLFKNNNNKYYKDNIKRSRSFISNIKSNKLIELLEDQKKAKKHVEFDISPDNQKTINKKSNILHGKLSVTPQFAFKQIGIDKERMTFTLNPNLITLRKSSSGSVLKHMIEIHQQDLKLPDFGLVEKNDPNIQTGNSLKKALNRNILLTLAVHNVNIKAAMIHIIGDIIQSVGVIIASILIYLFPSYYILDPIMTIFFSIIVVFTTFPIIKECVITVMEAKPVDFDESALKEIVSKIPGVKEIRCVHVFCLSTDKTLIQLKVVSDEEDTLQKIRESVLYNFECFHLNVEIQKSYISYIENG